MKLNKLESMAIGIIILALIVTFAYGYSQADSQIKGQESQALQT